MFNPQLTYLKLVVAAFLVAVEPVLEPVISHVLLQSFPWFGDLLKGEVRYLLIEALINKQFFVQDGGDQPQGDQGTQWQVQHSGK